MCERLLGCEKAVDITVFPDVPAKISVEISSFPLSAEVCWPVRTPNPDSNGRFSMNRLALPAVLLALALPPATHAQNASGIVSYFTGKQVLVKIDMPGTQRGIDLRFNKDSPMNWKEYSSRIKEYGTAIHKGDIARITTIVVKKDMIEFQLDGGGYGTFGDDTNTTVVAKTVPKSDYEKSLEQQIANTDDPDKKRQLQRDLDRERARRERQDAINQSAAQVASQIKAQQVMDKRMQGGSRFNLRWQGSIPPGQLTPDAVMACLSEYVDFNGFQTAGPPQPAAPAPSMAISPQPPGQPALSPTAQLQRGMSLNDVANLLGQGKLLSQSTGDNGLKTEVYEYISGDRRAEVTFVEGTVVKFSITSQ